jgi:biopolymer transport protein ExbD
MERKRKKPKLMAEINITPFTDVILVLLIIFMIATPFIYQSSTKVELPQASASEETSKDLIVTINAQGEIFVDEAKTDLDTLKYKLMAKVRGKPNLSVIINGDKNVKYDSVIKVVDILNQSGIKHTALGIELKK